DARRGARGDPRIHRGLLQPPTPALEHRLPLARRLRSRALRRMTPHVPRSSSSPRPPRAKHALASTRQHALRARLAQLGPSREAHWLLEASLDTGEGRTLPQTPSPRTLRFLAVISNVTN